MEGWSAVGASKSAPSSEDALQVLADELLIDTVDLELHLDTICQRYTEICEQLRVKVPSSYASRRQTFDFVGDLKSKLGHPYAVNAVRHVGTLLTPVKQTMPTLEDDDKHDDTSQYFARLASRTRD